MLTLSPHRYLTSVEKRLHYLERLVAEKLPSLAIDKAPALQPDDGSASAEALKVSNTSSGSHIPVPSDKAGEDTATKPEQSLSEAVPDAADGFDWQEEANELVDGMAALSVEPTGAGYLGPYQHIRIFVSNSFPKI